MPHSFRDGHAFIAQPRIGDCYRMTVRPTAERASTNAPHRAGVPAPARRCLCRSGIGPHEAFLSPCHQSVRSGTLPRDLSAPYSAQCSNAQPNPPYRSNNERCKPGRISLSPPSIARASHPETRSSLACPQVTTTPRSGQYPTDHVFGLPPPRAHGLARSTPRAGDPNGQRTQTHILQRVTAALGRNRHACAERQHHADPRSRPSRPPSACQFPWIHMSSSTQACPLQSPPSRDR